MLLFKKQGKRGKIVYEQSDRVEFDKLRESFKTENNAARFARSVSYSINPWTYAISPLGSYNIGFTIQLLEKCKELHIQFQVEDNLKQSIWPQTFVNVIEQPCNPKYKYRDYQYSLLEKMLKFGRGIILSPTRSGKSLVLAGLCHNVLLNSSKNGIKNILLIVPNLQLLEQMTDDFINYLSIKKITINVTYKDKSKESFNNDDLIIIDNNEVTASKLKRGQIINNKKITKIEIDEEIIKDIPWHLVKFGANESKENNNVWQFQNMNIIISNAQWLLLHGDKLPYIDMIINDEVHGVKTGTEISKLIKGVDINFKFGCTGTLPKNTEDIWNIIGVFGPILGELTVVELQKAKILADVSIKPIRFNHSIKENFKNQVFDKNGNKVTDTFEIAQRIYQTESMYLSEYEPTNKIITKLATGIIKQHPDWNVLILFDYIKQGNSLFNCLEWKNKFYIDGSIDINTRQDIVQEMNAVEGGKITCANAKCFGTGITVERIQCIFIVINGSSPTKVIQSIGRGLQRNVKDTLLIFDISHDYKYSKKHYNEREELYQNVFKKNTLEMKKINI